MTCASNEASRSPRAALGSLGVAADQLVLEGVRPLEDGFVDSLGFVAQRLQPLAGVVHRVPVDLGDAADGLDHALLELRDGFRPAFRRFALADAQGIGDSGAVVAQLRQARAEAFERRGFGGFDLVAMRFELIAQRVGTTADGGERLDLAAVEIGAEGGAALGQLGEALGGDFFELCGLGAECGERLVDLAP